MELGTWNGKKLSVTLEKEEFLITAEVSEGGETLAEMTLTLPSRASPEGFLHTFYVNPRKNRADGQANVTAYKGLGKAMMCAVINKLVSEGSLSPTDVIGLEASGGNSTMEQRKAMRESGMTDAEMKESLGKYNGLLGDLENYCRDAEDREVNREDLVETLCNVNENKRLVEYYKTYGFTVVPGKDRGYVTEMTGTVGGILGACKPKGGKTRRAYSAGYTRRRAHGVRARTKRSSHTRNTRR